MAYYPPQGTGFPVPEGYSDVPPQAEGQASSGDSGEYDGIRYEIINSRSTTALAKIYLPEGQSIRAIPGCMVATSANIQIKGKLKKTLKAIFGPDEAVYQTMTAVEGPGWVMIAPGFYGEVKAFVLRGDEEVLLGDDAYLAATDGITSTSKSQGMKKAFFSGDGAFVKKAKGNGIIFAAAVGGFMNWNLREGETIVVDNGHLVMWTNKMSYKISKASKGLFSTGMSGEGMVAKMTGPGQVWIQSRNPEELAEHVYDTVDPASHG